MMSTAAAKAAATERHATERTLKHRSRKSTFVPERFPGSGVEFPIVQPSWSHGSPRPDPELKTQARQGPSALARSQLLPASQRSTPPPITLPCLACVEQSNSHRQSSHNSCRWRNVSATRYFLSRRWAARPLGAVQSQHFACSLPAPHHASPRSHTDPLTQEQQARRVRQWELSRAHADGSSRRFQGPISQH